MKGGLEWKPQFTEKCSCPGEEGMESLKLCALVSPQPLRSLCGTGLLIET